MKRLMKETSIHGRRGPRRVITYGYDTQVAGLDVIRTINGNNEYGDKFTPIHRNSGLSIAVYFTSGLKAVKFANKYLKGFDFTLDKDDLLRDGKLLNCVRNAKDKEGL